ncbi:MAG: CRISPR-associated endoribonuclease Cas6, partial [Terriglobia bacterium]
MRLYFELSPNTQPVPWDYQHLLIGAFHKWLGRNELHDGVSLYSLSWLSGGQAKDNSLTFPKGATWFVSCYEIETAKKLLGSVLSDPEVCCGMRVIGVRLAEPPEFTGQQRFLVATPVLVRKFDGQTIKHLTFIE